MEFLEMEIQRILLGTTSAPNWQSDYQLQAYMRGIERTRAQLIAQGASLVPTAEEIQLAAGLPVFTAVASLGGQPDGPIHQDALEFLFTRSYNSLKNWTDKMAQEVRQALFDGVSEGLSIQETTRNILKRVDVTRSRARLIAQTETIQAYQISSSNEIERSSQELDEEIFMRWLTRLDGRVRHLHAKWHGKLMTTREYRKNINISPYNCRCGNAPVIAEANTKKKQDRFDEERKKLLTLERT
jgi:SPP1 gp7 family putative phage head morphogenesis protein